ncbi:hypothetical protein GMA19_00248 [Paenibacillus polymyxa E681]|uniref:hypothetical protein n=1 Tax=Paenibacillus polymyxa TaxID=1406 RepID=UPI0001E316E1|nr:hypothetical protein [Paenibacillus polymyxa]ADM68128.1 hypothetical protein PPE_00246 [Paenibacillus polymyxa E681]QNV55126.1 hypothetical protein GE561_00248 [Paenibacillus polymyxa E681]QNV59963.1 hypothetical protein GMA19_00248 [Paenibacillus polymyxa E681]
MVKSQSKEKITIEELVDSYSINIIRTAKKIISARINFDKWLLEDLIQQGYVGLIEAQKIFLKVLRNSKKCSTRLIGSCGLFALNQL